VSKDTGVGISENDLPKVFDKFYQTGERTSSDISGTGLGFLLPKEIVECTAVKFGESKKAMARVFKFYSAAELVNSLDFKVRDLKQGV